MPNGSIAVWDGYCLDSCLAECAAEGFVSPAVDALFSANPRIHARRGPSRTSAGDLVGERDELVEDAPHDEALGPVRAQQRVDPPAGRHPGERDQPHTGV